MQLLQLSNALHELHLILHLTHYILLLSAKYPDIQLVIH